MRQQKGFASNSDSGSNVYSETSAEQKRTKAFFLKQLLSPCDIYAHASACGMQAQPWCAAVPPQSCPRASHLEICPSRKESEEGIAVHPHGQDVICCHINLGNHYVFVTFILLSKLIPDRQEFSALMGPRGICKFKNKIGRTQKCMWWCSHGVLSSPPG